MSTIGKFGFVEERTFITPPKLPQKPEEYKEPNKFFNFLSKLLVWGIILLLAAFIAIIKEHIPGVVLLPGILFTALGILGCVLKAQITEHNRKVTSQIKAWNRAWTKWEENNFQYSFQECINGELSRICDAVFDCIKQVSAEVFAVTAETEDDKCNMNELEQLIARRKEEYK